MNILMIDVGNTTADFRVWCEQEQTITNFIRPLTNEVKYKSPDLIIELLQAKHIEISKIFYVSVVPEWNDVIRALGELLKVEVFNIRNIVDLTSKDFCVDDSTKIGADFICNFYAAKKLYHLENGIIISMGTATTFLLVQNSVVVGTIIAPGLMTALNGLISNAALLRANQYSVSKKLIGTNTVDAINLGGYNAHFLMTKAVVRELAKNYKIGQVIYTGGNSLLFEQAITSELYKFNEKLIFEGIVDIFKKYFK